MNLRSFKFNRVNLDPRNMSNAGDFSWSWILKGFYSGSKRGRKIRCGMFTPSIKRQIRRFHVVVVQWTSKKCTKKRDVRAELLFWSLNLLFFSKLSLWPLSWLLKLSIRIGLRPSFSDEGTFSVRAREKTMETVCWRCPRKLRFQERKSHSRARVSGNRWNTDILLLRTVFFVPGESPYIFSKFNPLYTDTR